MPRPSAKTLDNTKGKKPPKTARILGVDLSGTSKAKLLAFLDTSLKKNKQFTIVTPNPEILVAASKEHSLAQILNSADVSLPDGTGLLWATKSKKLTKIPGRVAMLWLFELANEKGLKVFLLGSSNKVIKDSISKFKKDYPSAKIAGLSGPILDGKAMPVDKKQKKVLTSSLGKINKFEPDILFVAFGAPKQEYFLAKHLSDLKVGGAMAVGGSLDYYSGKKALPPKWMENIGLEWLWRLGEGPKHIKRIFNAIIVFPVLVIFSRLKSPFSRI